MGRTALGTATKTSGTTVTLASVALAAGETIIVLTTINDGGCMGVTWNGEALTQAVQSTQLNAMCTAGIFYKKITAGATGSVVATFDMTGDAAIAVLKHDTLLTAPLDKTAAADGAASTGANSGNTATTVQADEFLIGCAGVAGPSTDTAPTWLNSFTAGQRAGTTGGAALDSTVCEGYRTVAATGAYSAAATLGTARDWAAAIATFKIAVAQTSTPTSIDVPAVANIATGVPGPASSAPASHAVPVVANNATSIIGARVVTPESLAIVMAPATAVEEGGATVVVRGARLPATVTVQNFIVIRPTAPAALGDGDAATGVTLSYAPVVNPLNPAGGSIEIVASTIADVPLPPGQTITHLRFRALAYSFEDQTSAPGLTNYRMGWKVGANAVEGVVTNEDPGWTYLNPVRRDVDGLDVGDSTVPNYYVSTGNITTRPGGGAWTAADVNALVDVALRLTYAAGTEFLDLTVAEFLIEVHGQIGSAPVVISVPQKMGRLVRHQKFNRNL